LLSAIGYVAIPRLGAVGYVGAHIGASVVMLCTATAVCWRSGQIEARFVLLALTLLGLLVLMSLGSFYLSNHPQAEGWRLLLLVPIATTAAIAGRELLGGVRAPLGLT
jgi:hypothetical protein